MDKAEEDDPVDLFFKKDGLYMVLWYIRDGSVVCSCQLFTKSLKPAALRNKRNRYGAFVQKLKSPKKDVEAVCPNPISKNKTDNLAVDEEELVEEDQVLIHEYVDFDPMIKHYNGETAKNWNLKFPTEEERNRLDIIKMRVRLATKILSHEINIHQEKISTEAQKFAIRNTDKNLRKKMTKEAIKTKKEKQESEGVQSNI
nr:ulp1 protease family, C-terminal catalytic domain-containing protein [Tanacetum cinerariifolium]